MLQQEKYGGRGQAVTRSKGPFDTEISSEYMFFKLKHPED
jgi:hypothetical protein